MSAADRRLEICERVGIDVFAFALMIHCAVRSFDGGIRVAEALAVTTAIGLIQRGQRRSRG